MKGSGSKLVAGLLAGAALAALATPAFAADAPSGGGTTTFTIFFHIMDWLVITILVLSSIAVVALVIDAIMHIREAKVAPPETTEHLRTLITSRQFKELMDFTATDNTFVSQSIYSGVRRAHLKYPAMREAMESTMGEQTANLYRRIEFLNVIGNIGPLIGLLGTVLGMIIAFYEMNAAGGNAKPAQLAGGISTALWHTFGGLFVAIPALVVYGFYRTRVDKITTQASIVAEELLEMLRPESAAAAPAEEPRAKRKVAAAPSPVPQPQVSED
jgi:biopolymer transport protein ExbB